MYSCLDGLIMVYLCAFIRSSLILLFSAGSVYLLTPMALFLMRHDPTNLMRIKSVHLHVIQDIHF